jgi:hypothetical protein
MRGNGRCLTTPLDSAGSREIPKKQQQQLQQQQIYIALDQFVERFYNCYCMSFDSENA